VLPNHFSAAFVVDTAAVTVPAIDIELPNAYQREGERSGREHSRELPMRNCNETH
jgi:hypothetical protein